MTFARFARLAAVGGLLLLAATASAQSIDDARSAFTEARFLDAAGLAEAVGTSQGYALAARSLACTATMSQPRRIGAGFSNARWGWPRRPCAPIRPTPRRTSNPPTLLADTLKPWVRSRRFAEASPARSATCSRRRLPSIPTSPKRTWPSAAGTPTSLVPDSLPDRCTGEAERTPSPTSSVPLELEPESKVVLLEYAARLPELDSERGRERARELLSKALELPVWDASEEFLQKDIVEALAALEGE